MKNFRTSILSASVLALLLATLAVAAWGRGVNGASTVTTAQSLCSAIQLRPRRAMQGPEGHKFSATDVIDLELRVLLSPRIVGDHLLRLRLFTPSGHLYQELTVPFTTDSTSRSERKVAGYPRPMKVRRAKPGTFAGNAVNTISIYFPVGGTSIVTNSLYGKWTIEAFVDDSASPCSHPTSFTITQ